MSEIHEGDVWRHLKTDHLYVIEGTCIIEATCAPAVLYRRHEGGELYSGNLWCRPILEFLDGRFVLEPQKEPTP